MTNIIKFPSPLHTKEYYEILEDDDIHSAYEFFGEIITDLMIANISNGQTISTALCMLAHDIFKGQHMDDDEIEDFVDSIFPRSGVRFDMD